VKFRIFIFLLILTSLGSQTFTSAQIDSVIGQVTTSPAESFAGGISGDGRYIVFESIGNFATENPRNADNNREIFLFDYAQRRIFQITDTKSLLTDPDLPSVFSNIKVSIDNTRPTISNDGRWIAFSSNATTSTPAMPDSTNPGNFDANSFTDDDDNNPLTADGNTEIWLYQIPVAPSADLSSGAEIPITNLSSGTFTRITNTLPSRLPVAGTTTTGPFIADDNHDASISDNGNMIAFASTRDLVPAVGNAFPNDDNNEIFSYNRTSNTISQVTKTPRGSIADPVVNRNPTISGNGLRVAFSSNADDPIVNSGTGTNFDTGTNSDKNFEIFFTDLETNGTASVGGLKKQITATTRTNPGDVVNIFNFGKRISRNGRLIAFDSYADLINENGNTNQTGFAVFLYDVNTDSSRRIGPRSDADSGAFGGDVQHYPSFTDYDASGAPQTLIMETRLNITAQGTIPATPADGLNPTETRPSQIYKYPLTPAPADATFTRLSTLPPSQTFVASTQPIPSNSSKRITFSLALTEVGTGNFDLQSEIYYLLTPTIVTETAERLSFATGASRIPVSPDPVPTPSPTPTPSPSPSPSPTPQTPPAVQGISPGMLAIVNFQTGINQPVQARTAIGSFSRSFPLPMELSGVTMTINGVSVGLKSVSRREIVFVAPRALPTDPAGGITHTVVINNNGTVIRGTVTYVTARPDIFTESFTDPDGNLFTNRAKILNVTTRVSTREPFTVTTIPIRRNRRVQTILRLFLTGIDSAPANVITIQIGDIQIFPNQQGNAVLQEPGVYSIDFALPPGLEMAGDVPIVVTINFNNLTYQSRLQDTAPRTRIL
jgi:uncharacterized protein (TIGR03437 family)